MGGRAHEQGEEEEEAQSVVKPAYMTLPPSIGIPRTANPHTTLTPSPHPHPRPKPSPLTLTLTQA